jgi:hypothetical protein
MAALRVAQRGAHSQEFLTDLHGLFANDDGTAHHQAWQHFRYG